VHLIYAHPFYEGSVASFMTDHPRLISTLGLAARGVSRDTLPYKARFQPYASWFALIATAIMMLFKGFDTFIHGKDEPFKAAEFVSYVCTPHTFILRAYFICL
jgi:yeast amino acid transporter